MNVALNDTDSTYMYSGNIALMQMMIKVDITDDSIILIIANTEHRYILLTDIKPIKQTINHKCTKVPSDTVGDHILYNIYFSTQ